jgi:hypothetical protein
MPVMIPLLAWQNALGIMNRQNKTVANATICLRMALLIPADCWTLNRIQVDLGTSLEDRSDSYTLVNETVKIF